MEATKKISVYNYVTIALMAAVICILGPLSIALPFTPVPISFTNLALYCTVYVLGWKRGTISYFIYLLVGFAGMPVFSGFSSGASKLLGPTGGYLIGFIFMTIICGFVIEQFDNRVIQGLGMVGGTLIAYAFGTVWLAYQGGYTFMQALALGVLPYLIGDGVKIVIACMVGPEIRKRLIGAGLLS